MAYLLIPMDVSRRERLAHRAAEVGCKDIGELIDQLIDRELAEAEIEALGGPPHLTFRNDADLERILRERIDDSRPSIEVTPEFWDDIRRRAGLPPKRESHG